MTIGGSPRSSNKKKNSTSTENPSLSPHFPPQSTHAPGPGTHLCAGSVVSSLIGSVKVEEPSSEGQVRRSSSNEGVPRSAEETRALFLSLSTLFSFLLSPLSLKQPKHPASARLRRQENSRELLFFLLLFFLSLSGRRRPLPRHPHLAARRVRDHSLRRTKLFFFFGFFSLSFFDDSNRRGPARHPPDGHPPRPGRPSHRDRRGRGPRLLQAGRRRQGPRAVLGRLSELSSLHGRRRPGRGLRPF